MDVDYGVSHMAMPICFAYESTTVCSMDSIGERIRHKRKALGLRQGDLAALIGLDQSTISDIENGKGFGADVLMRICVALRTDPYYVMSGEESAQANELRLLNLYRSCSDVDKRLVIESAAAFAARNEKPAPAPKSMTVLQRITQQLPQRLGSPLQESFGADRSERVRKTKKGKGT